MSLIRMLNDLRSELAEAAQRVYNEWDQDEEGIDEELGAGGICDRVSEAMENVIYNELIGVNCMEGGQEGEDHSWLVVYGDDEAAGVDIPPGVYETGSGYSWKKIEGVTIKPEDVNIFELDRSDFEFEEE